MLYSESVPVRFSGGLHNGTLNALAPFGAHGLRVNGYDPQDVTTWDTILQQHRDPNSLVELSAEHPDPQTARDLVQIGKHTTWLGRTLWPGRPEGPPSEHFNSVANALRQHEGLPPEGQMQVQAQYVTLEEAREIGRQVLEEEHQKSKDSALVRGDMSTHSKWNVVALGELQQPSGVGATTDYNPVVDGPNPNGPDFGDNAGNSPEQETALQTWVNTAVDLLNRGTSPEEVVARLAHDGCPNPEEVMQRAQQQPEHSPVTDGLGQDAFEVPPTPDPTMNGQMESTSMQPPVTTAKRVRVAGTTMVGTEIDRWEGLWGEGTVKIALDDGGTIDVAPDALEPVEGTSAKHPVSEIQAFVDSMPEVRPSRPWIEARLANLELVRRAVRANISKVGFSDQVKLQTLDTAAESETEVLKEILANKVEDFEVAYAKAQPRFAYNAFNVATAEDVEYGGHAKEAGAIWATENFDSVTDDDDLFTAAAAHYAHGLGLNGPQFQEFLAAANEHRKVRTEEFTAEEPVDHDGPAEALFVS